MGTLHIPILVGSVGKRDRDGWGSKVSVWSYPSLDLDRVVLTDSTGGVIYPKIEGVFPSYERRPPNAPNKFWGQWGARYHLPSGRKLRPVILSNGWKAFEEE